MVIARLFFPLTLGACLIISIIHRNFNKIQVTKITNKHQNRSSLQVAWKRIIKAMKKNSTKNTFWCKLFSFIHIAKQTVKDQQYRTPTVQAYQEPILDYVIELKTIHGCIVKQMSLSTDLRNHTGQPLLTNLDSWWQCHVQIRRTVRQNIHVK